jgi:type IV fimbrial biogenesis protein FimT
LELVFALTVAGILLSVGVPSFIEIIRDNRSTANANNLVSALAIARSEAIRRGVRVTLCRSSDGATCGGNWADGWIAFIDGAASDTAAPIVGQLLNAWSAPEANPTLTTQSGGAAADVPWVRFLPRGTARTNVAMPIVYNIVPENCSSQQARTVELNGVGRTRVTRIACP